MEDYNGANASSTWEAQPVSLVGDIPPTVDNFIHNHSRASNHLPNTFWPPPHSHHESLSESGVCTGRQHSDTTFTRPGKSSVILVILVNGGLLLASKTTRFLPYWGITKQRQGIHHRWIPTGRTHHGQRNVQHCGQRKAGIRPSSFPRSAWPEPTAADWARCSGSGLGPSWQSKRWIDHPPLWRYMWRERVSSGAHDFWIVKLVLTPISTVIGSVFMIISWLLDSWLSFRMEKP